MRSPRVIEEHASAAPIGLGIAPDDEVIVVEPGAEVVAREGEVCEGVRDAGTESPRGVLTVVQELPVLCPCGTPRKKLSRYLRGGEYREGMRHRADDLVLRTRVTGGSHY
jgi:hypothetical protein